MSKTIDVRGGDTWTAHPSEFRLLQHRDGKNREIASLGYTGYYGSTAFVPTAEDIAKHVKEQAIDRVRGFSREELERLSKDTLVAFINAVRDAKKQEAAE